MMNVKIKTVLGMTVLLLLSCFNFAQAKVLNKIVAVVNNDVITQSDLDKKMAQMQKQLKNSNAKIPSSIKLRRDALNGLIDVSLQLQLAKSNGLVIGDSEVNGVISNIAKGNGLTVEQLKVVLPEREGISFNEFKNQIREQGLITRLQQQVLGKGIVVDKKDIDRVLKSPPKVKSIPAQYHVIDILFENPKEGSKVEIKNIESAAKELALKLKSYDKSKRLELIKKAHKSLEKQVVIRSDDLGWREINGFPEIFVKKIVKMKKGQVVGPIKAPNGLHLLQLVDVNKGSSEYAKLTKEQAAEMAFHSKLVKKIKPWLKELRKKAYIKVY